MAILPRPRETDTSMWVDESIWGHRLYNEQTPWMTFLEFVGILQSELESGRPFAEVERNGLKYSPRSRLFLRNILFNNPRLEAILEEYPDDDETQWAEWLRVMKESRGGIESPDYSYLRGRFSSFRQFAALVQFLQSNAIEGNSNKRWSSKFVFPYGPHCLYEDLNVKSSTNFSNDRRFFARTGELLYLMLCRSGAGSDLLFQLQTLNLIGDARADARRNVKWDLLVAALQPEEDLQKKRESGKPPYLPHEDLEEYRALADDWLRIFGCQMPGYDSLPHVVSLTGLHLTLYLLNMAHREIGDGRRATFVVEIVAPKKTAVRELSANTYLENNLLTLQAVKARINSVRSLPEWQEALDSEDSVEDALAVLNRLFDWPAKDEPENVNSPDKLLESLETDAETRHKQHLGRCHADWTREIGFSSSRGSRRTRYAPTDALLKSLVISTVEYREEFQEFLKRLYEKYGMIIGHVQARELIESGAADEKDFSDNAARLEERLTSMGLLKRLSDACAYVINPFSAGSY